MSEDAEVAVTKGSDGQPVLDLEISEARRIVGEFKEYKGHHGVDTRIMFRKANGDWEYGKGLWIPIDGGTEALEAVIEFLQAALLFLKES